jgi:hypothetical protein
MIHIRANKQVDEKTRSQNTEPLAASCKSRTRNEIQESNRRHLTVAPKPRELSYKNRKNQAIETIHTPSTRIDLEENRNTRNELQESYANPATRANRLHRPIRDECDNQAMTKRRHRACKNRTTSTSRGNERAADRPNNIHIHIYMVVMVKTEIGMEVEI